MKRSGFTLIEVLIVIVVIAILAAIIMPRLLADGEHKRGEQLRLTLDIIRNSIAEYKEDKGTPPKLLTCLVSDEDSCLATFDGLLPVNAVSFGNVEGVDWVYDKETGEVHAKAGMPKWDERFDTTDYSTW